MILVATFHLMAAMALATVPASNADAPRAPIVIDAFDDVSAWSAHPASGVELKIASDAGATGKAMRLDFDFKKGGGYAVAHRAVSLDLPENYAFTFQIRGRAPVNHLEFKLIDTTGENVWWHVKRDLAWPADWTPLRIKKRQIQFAWGPLGGGELKHVAAIEVVVTAGSGGSGTVWVDDLALVPLPLPSDRHPPKPVVRVSSSRSPPAVDVVGEATLLVLDAHSWRSGFGDTNPWLALDLGASREFGAVILDWAHDLHPRDYAIEVSDDGSTWRTLRIVHGSNGGWDASFTPESDARHLRIRAFGSRPIGIQRVSLGPVSWETRADFFKALADPSIGGYADPSIGGGRLKAPSLGPNQTYWTVVGIDGGRDDGLMGEDGTIEVGRGGFSIEPIVRIPGRVMTDAFMAEVSVPSEQSLEGGATPIPTVRRTFSCLRDTSHMYKVERAVELTATAFGIGADDSCLVVARYRVRNIQRRRERVTLALALRPFQVNPVSQFLNGSGGPARIRSVTFNGPRAVVNDSQQVVSLIPPSRVGASTWDSGEIGEHLEQGRLPATHRVVDDFEAASGAFVYDLSLAPGEEREVDLVAPLGSARRRFDTVRLPPPGEAMAWTIARQDDAAASWKRRFGRVSISIPDSAVERTLEAQLGWILLDRAGPALQPGTRAYARSWIRDGALTSTALLRLGQYDVVRDFIEWFAPYQYDDGKVPCCVDQRGSDPVPEHDSSGEFIYLVAEYFRHTGDRALVERMWPRVATAVDYLDSLRQTRRTREYRGRGKSEFFGLLPPSISHEGYSAKPMHSYWDDFFALRGFKDAAFLATALGRPREAATLARIREQFEGDLRASIATAMAKHKIDYVPGCADLGDFDATSTTIALTPVAAEKAIPPRALQRTFEKWLEFQRERVAGNSWDAFTPYELRIVGSFVRLGWRDQALDLLRWLSSFQRPRGWVQWAEVVGREERKQRFLGDMPHGWVASDAIRSILDMLAYEREADSSLVIGGGVPREWLSGAGVEVGNLSTHYGNLSYSMREKDGVVEVGLRRGIRVPPGGIVIAAPSLDGFRSGMVNGKPAHFERDGSVIVREPTAWVELRH